MSEKHYLLIIDVMFSGAISILSYAYLPLSIFALSPPFSQQEISDEVGQWIDLSTKGLTKSGDRYTDIVSVDYSSNGTTLNAILWLLFPFKENPDLEGDALRIY